MVSHFATIANQIALPKKLSNVSLELKAICSRVDRLLSDLFDQASPEIDNTPFGLAEGGVCKGRDSSMSHGGTCGLSNPNVESSGSGADV